MQAQGESNLSTGWMGWASSGLKGNVLGVTDRKDVETVSLYLTVH